MDLITLEGQNDSHQLSVRASVPLETSICILTVPTKYWVTLMRISWAQCNTSIKQRFINTPWDTRCLLYKDTLLNIMNNSQMNTKFPLSKILQMNGIWQVHKHYDRQYDKFFKRKKYSTQYCLMAYMGKASRKVDICITESLCYTPETNLTLWINYTLINLKKKSKK